MYQLVNCFAVDYKLSVRKMATEAKFLNTNAKEVMTNKIKEEFYNKIKFNNVM